MSQMNIREAARWAERKDALVRVVNGEPHYLYAVYDTGNHMVDLVGGYDKCKAYALSRGCEYVPTASGQHAADGRWLKMVSLEQVCEEMGESEGEARCVPDAWEQREWA